MTHELARDLIAQERQTFPEVVELARCLALAVRVETELLRSMRLEVMPHIDAGVEANLFFSPLVQARDVNAIVLVPEVRTQLLEELALHKDELENARRVIEAAHADLDAVILLEEMVAYYSLRADTEGFHQAQQRLGTIVKELMKSEVDRDLVQWSARAFPRLPARAQNSHAGRALRHTVNVQLSRLHGEKTDSGTIALALPEQPVHFGFRFRSFGAQLCSAPRTGWIDIQMPGPFPVSVEIGWPVAGGWESVNADIAESQDIQSFPAVPPGLVRLRGIHGDETRLRPAGPYPDLQPRLVCIHDGSRAEFGEIEDELADLDWQFSQVDVFANDNSQAGAGVNDNAAACLLSFADTGTLSDYLKPGSGGLPAVLDRAIVEQRPVLILIGAHLTVVAEHEMPTLKMSDSGFDPLIRFEHLINAISGKLVTSSPREEIHFRERLRGALLAGERNVIDAWVEGLQAAEDERQPSDPPQAMVMIQWERWFPPGASGPTEFDSYRSGKARLTRLIGNGGTLWVVTSRQLADGQRQYQLAYRLKNVEVVEPSSADKRDRKEHRVRCAAPDDVTQFPLHDATEELLALRFTTGKPMLKPGDIGQRLRTIPQLSVADVNRLEALVDRLGVSTPKASTRLRGVIAGDGSQGHPGTVRSIAISDDGTVAMTAGNSSPDGSIRIWDLDSLRLLHVLAGQAVAGGWTPMAISADRTLAVVGYDDRLTVWMLETGEQVLRGQPEGEGAGSTVTAVAIAGSDLALAGFENGEVVCTALRPDPSGDRPGWSLSTEGSVLRLAASFETGLCLSASRLVHFSLETGDVLQSVAVQAGESALHFQHVPLLFSDDGSHALYGTPLRAVRLADGSEGRTFEIDTPADDAVFGRTLSSDDGESITVIDGYTDTSSFSLSIEPDRASCLALSGSGTRLVVADYEHNLRVFDLPPVPSGVALPVTQRQRPRPAPSPGSSVAIDLLPARHGCSLLIGYGNPESPEHILVDAGPRGVGKVIRERLMKLPDPNRGLELLVLTHRDSDAIGGALELLQDRIDVPVRDVWYNGARHQANGAEQAEASRETLGAIRRDALSVLLQERNQSWNGAFDGKAVVVDEAVLPVIALRGGMKVTLLSPRPDELGNALARWDQAGRAGDAGLSDEPLGESPPSGDMASSRSTGRELTPETVEALAREPYRADRSVNNGASIAFVAEYQGAAVLVGGDAYAEILVESIRRFLDERSLQRLTLSGMVVPHNGSHRNLSAKLLSLVDCPRYLFSSDGSRFRHPDRQTIARILVDRQRADTGSVLYFNYRSDQTAIWDDDLLKNYFNYETVYPEQDGLGLRNIPL